MTWLGLDRDASMQNYYSKQPHQRQDGAATIAMAIILLILISVAVFTVNGSIIRETKVINSGVRSQQAFEAAEAGMAAALDYYRENDDEISDLLINVGSATALVNAVEIASVDEIKMIRVESKGTSDDGTAQRTVTQIVSKPDPLPNLPDNPLSARTNVTIVGSATVINPEGNFNIWTGGDVDLSQNNQGATLIADPQQTSPCQKTTLSWRTDSPACITRSSDKDSEGQDLVQNDLSLINNAEDQLFEYYFGLPKQIYRDYIVTLDTTAADIAALNDPLPAEFAEEVIWIDGDNSITELENKLLIGCGRTVFDGGASCEDDDIKPSVLIIDGDAKFDGAEIFGLVYVTGNVEVTSSTDIEGAVIVGGELKTNKTGGSFDLIYNSDVLRAARSNGSMLPVAGSWKDFN